MASYVYIMWSMYTYNPLLMILSSDDAHNNAVNTDAFFRSLRSQKNAPVTAGDRMPTRLQPADVRLKEKE